MKYEKWAVCGCCGWAGPNTELIPDDGPDPHPCGKDECPECHEENFICCCLTEAEAWRRSAHEA